MTPEMIEELARKIVERQTEMEYWRYAIWFALIVVASYLGAYIKSYAADNAKLRSIQDNLKTVLDQLSKTTATATKIQLALGHDDWQTKEYKVLRKTKLESLTFSLYEVRDWTYQLMTQAHSVTVDVTKSPINTVLVISSLYFPEFVHHRTAFFLSYQQLLNDHFIHSAPVVEAERVRRLSQELFEEYQRTRTRDSLQAAMELFPELNARKVALNDAQEKYAALMKPRYSELQTALTVFRKEISSLMADTITPS